VDILGEGIVEDGELGLERLILLCLVQYLRIIISLLLGTRGTRLFVISYSTPCFPSTNHAPTYYS
jgi:hypothetical protein